MLKRAEKELNGQYRKDNNELKSVATSERKDATILDDGEEEGNTS